MTELRFNGKPIHPDNFSEAEFVEIGKRFVEAVKALPQDIHDPEFVDRCLENLSNGDRSLLETLPENEQRVIENLHETFQSG